MDVLVNNAGRGIVAPVEAVTAQELRDLLEVNLVGVLTATQAALPVMRRQRSGHIINVSSVAGRRATALSSAYNATKFALVGLSEALRQGLRGTGIQVSIVYPIDTESEFHHVKLKKTEQPRYGPIQSAATVARAIVRCARRPRPEVRGLDDGPDASSLTPGRPPPRSSEPCQTPERPLNAGLAFVRCSTQNEIESQLINQDSSTL